MVMDRAEREARIDLELTGELYDDDEIEDFFYDDISNLEAENRERITFDEWLVEMLLNGGSTRRNRFHRGPHLPPPGDELRLTIPAVATHHQPGVP